MELLSLFPIHVYAAQVDNVELCQEQISNAVENSVEFHPTTQWGYSHDLSTKTFGDDHIHDFGLTHLENSIDKSIGMYMNAIGQRKRKYTRTSWFTRNTKGQFTIVHNHGDADISGVYWHKTTSEDGNFFFDNPNLAAHSSRIFNHEHLRMDVPPIEGNLILFPGWMPHGVYVNETDSKRMSISWNIYLER